jgi:SAM-dependent methyltransferase
MGECGCAARSLQYTEAPHKELLIKFVCNICGVESEKDAAQLGREDRACAGPDCGSTGRWRSIIYCVSQALFGRSLTLLEMPEDKSIVGIGLSDAKIYADGLAKKFSYTNTYYHREPLLDITKIPPESENSVDFLIASDVFEHIVQPVSIAFSNAYKLLKPTGSFIFTVPFKLEGETDEWFPRLNQYSIIDFFGEQILVNRTINDEFEVHRKLSFHDGGGATLEMRLFSLPGIVSEMRAAGFPYISILHANLPEFGILNKNECSVPVIASKAPIKTTALSVLEPASFAASEQLTRSY